MLHSQLANQANIDFEKPNHLHRDFSQIENKNKTAIKNQLESINSNRVLRLSSSDVNLSSNLFFRKINQLLGTPSNPIEYKKNFSKQP